MKNFERDMQTPVLYMVCFFFPESGMQMCSKKRMKLYVMMIFTANSSKKLSSESHFYLDGFSVRVTVTLFSPKMFFNSVSDMFLILPSLVKLHEFVS